MLARPAYQSSGIYASPPLQAMLLFSTLESCRHISLYSMLMLLLSLYIGEEVAVDGKLGGYGRRSGHGVVVMTLSRRRRMYVERDTCCRLRTGYILIH